MATASSEDASATFAEVASAMTFGELPASAVDVARRGILDSLGVCVAAEGAAFGDLAAVRALAVQQRAPTGVSVLGLKEKLHPLDAAFWLGSHGHVLDYDDLVDMAHPSAPVVSAAVPTAQARGPITGKELLLSVALGQEIVSRLTLCLGQSLGDYGWIPALPAVFGATITAGKLIRLSESQMRNALGLSLHQASGTMQSIAGVGSAYRAVRDGFNARAGVLAATLAEEGLPGDRDCFEGRYGLFQQFFGGDYRRDVLVEGFGEDFRSSAIGFKSWPCAGHPQLYLTALEELLTNPAVSRESIRRITVVGNGDLIQEQCEPRALRIAPPQGIDAKVSIPFLIGKLICRGTIRLEDFSPSGLNDAEAISAAQLVEWKRDPELKSTRQAFGPGVVEIELRDGRQLSATADVAQGHPDRPLSWARMVEKFHECISASGQDISVARAESVVGYIENLEDMPDVNALAHSLWG